MTCSFATKETPALFANRRVRCFSADWLPVARRKLAQLNRVVSIEELRLPPGNRLERLAGDWAGQWSLRINTQWRLCLAWRDGHAWEVEIVDDH